MWRDESIDKISSYLKSRHGDETIERSVQFEKMDHDHILIKIVGKSSTRQKVNSVLPGSETGVDMKTKARIDESLEAFEDEKLNVSRCKRNYKMRYNERVSEIDSHTVFHNHNHDSRTVSGRLDN